MICPSCGVYSEGSFDVCCADRQADFDQGIERDTLDTLINQIPAPEED